ncbi:MAG: starch-binding protein, partial [Ruminococcus sp.]|nr:starch-binding protein [Ruminococcus sp.]
TEPQYTEPPFPDYPDPTPDYATVLFTNNKGWQGTIYCYYWFDGDAPEWPGEPMSEVGMNDYGEPQYSIEIPLGVNVIFTNGESQTADAVFSGQTGFYPTDDMNDQGHYIAGSW